MRPPYTCLYREIWDDERFWGLSEVGKLVYVYVLSTPMGNGLGCYKAGTAAMSEESRLLPERFQEGFQEGLANGLFHYDEHYRVILIPKYFERNSPANPNGIKALSKEFLKIPDCALKSECYQLVKVWVEKQKESFAEPFNELFAEPIPEQPGTYSPSLSLSYSPSVSPPLSPSPAKAPSVSTDVDNIGPRQAKKKKPFEYPSDFEAFWIEYPKHRRVEKQLTYKEWQAADKKGLLPDIQTILATLRAQKKSPGLTKDGGQYMLKARKWVRGACWDDEIDTSQPRPKGQDFTKMTASEQQYWRNRQIIERDDDEESKSEYDSADTIDI